MLLYLVVLIGLVIDAALFQFAWNGIGGHFHQMEPISFELSFGLIVLVAVIQYLHLLFTNLLVLTRPFISGRDDDGFDF